MNWFTKAETVAEKVETAVQAEFRRLELWRASSTVNQAHGAVSTSSPLTEAEQALATVKNTGEAHVRAVVAAATVAGKKLVADAQAAASAVAQVKATALIAQAQATAQAAISAATAAATPTA